MGLFIFWEPSLRTRCMCVCVAGVGGRMCMSMCVQAVYVGVCTCMHMCVFSDSTKDTQESSLRHVS